MKRTPVAAFLKKFFVSIFICALFIIVLSYLLTGLGQKKAEMKNKSDIPEFYIEPDSIVFNDNYGGGPLIKVYITKENKLEEMYLEDYVRGVVAAEMPAEFNIEALKAQAVAARTFALSHMELFGGTKCDKAKGGDICDSAHCQVFLKKEDAFKKWSAKYQNDYWNKITEAVSKTSGEILTYDGNLVMAPYYFAVSSGKTEDARDVFAKNEPYLRSVSSPGEESAPKFKTSVKFSYSQLASKINAAYKSAKVTSKQLKNQISVKSTTSAGGIKEIRLGKVTVPGTGFRTLLGLNSTHFTIKFGSSYVEFDCKGYGHDVGMSQWGANAMAKAGKSYKDILEHYYSGVSVSKASNEEWKFGN